MFKNKGFIQFIYAKAEYFAVITNEHTNINTYSYFEWKKCTKQYIRPLFGKEKNAQKHA